MKPRRRLWSRLTGLNDPAPIDPSVFGDPVAEQTEWTPCKRGGANFRTHRIVQDRPDQLRFKASLGATLFALVFLFIGLLATGLSAHRLVHGPGSDSSLQPQIGVAFGLLFAFIGGFLQWHWLRPIVFDKTHGYYWKGRQKPRSRMRVEGPKDAVALKDIHALQLISERVSTRSRSNLRSTYLSYELNLVLEDGSRRCVVDHGNEQAIQEQARQLSEFLAVPLWIGY